MADPYVQVHVVVRHGVSRERRNTIWQANEGLRMQVSRLCEMPWSCSLEHAKPQCGIHEAYITFTCQGLETTRSNEEINSSITGLCRRLLTGDHDNFQHVRSGQGGLYRPVGQYDEYEPVTRMNHWGEEASRLWEIQHMFCQGFLEQLVDLIPQTRFVTVDADETEGRWLVAENLGVALSASDCANAAMDYVALIPPWQLGSTEENMLDFVLSNPNDAIAIETLELALQAMRGTEENAIQIRDASEFESPHALEDLSVGFLGAISQLRLAAQELSAVPSGSLDGLLRSTTHCLQYVGLLYDLSLERRDEIRGEANFWSNWAKIGAVATVVCTVVIPPLAPPCAAATGFAARQALPKSFSADVFMDHIRRASASLQKIWMFATLHQMNRERRFETDRHRILHFANHMEEAFHINISRNWTNSEYVAEFLGQEVTAVNKMLASVSIDRL